MMFGLTVLSCVLAANPQNEGAPMQSVSTSPPIVSPAAPAVASTSSDLYKNTIDFIMINKDFKTSMDKIKETLRNNVVYENMSKNISKNINDFLLPLIQQLIAKYKTESKIWKIMGPSINKKKLMGIAILLEDSIDRDILNKGSSPHNPDLARSIEDCNKVMTMVDKTPYTWVTEGRKIPEIANYNYPLVVTIAPGTADPKERKDPYPLTKTRVDTVVPFDQKPGQETAIQTAAEMHNKCVEKTWNFFVNTLVVQGVLAKIQNDKIIPADIGDLDDAKLKIAESLQKCAANCNSRCSLENADKNCSIDCETNFDVTTDNFKKKFNDWITSILTITKSIQTNDQVPSIEEATKTATESLNIDPATVDLLARLHDNKATNAEIDQVKKMLEDIPPGIDQNSLASLLEKNLRKQDKLFLFDIVQKYNAMGDGPKMSPADQKAKALTKAQQIDIAARYLRDEKLGDYGRKQAVELRKNAAELKESLSNVFMKN